MLKTFINLWSKPIEIFRVTIDEATHNWEQNERIKLTNMGIKFKLIFSVYKN